MDITAYGYLTHINGLPDAQLFTTPDPTKHSEATARFTLAAQGKLSGRYTLQNLIDTDTTLTLTIYFNATAGSNFARPDSFAAGTSIGAFTAHYQQILIVEAPNTGTVVGTGGVYSRIKRRVHSGQSAVSVWTQGVIGTPYLIPRRETHGANNAKVSICDCRQCGRGGRNQ